MNSQNKKLSLKKVTVLNFEETRRISGASDPCDWSVEICPITYPDSCEICQTVNDVTCFEHECTSY